MMTFTLHVDHGGTRVKSKVNNGLRKKYFYK